MSTVMQTGSMGMKPRVSRVCVVCEKPLTSARHNRKCCSAECSMKRRMAKQERRRRSRYGYHPFTGRNDKWAK